MDLLSVLGYAFAIIAGLGAGAAYFVKARGDALIAYLEKGVAARDGDIARLTTQNEYLLKENADLRLANSANTMQK